MPVVAVRRLAGFQPTPWSPPSDWIPVTPSDTDQFPELSYWLYIGTGGDLVVTTGDGNDRTFANVQAGATLYGEFVAVKTASTADDIMRGVQ